MSGDRRLNSNSRRFFVSDLSDHNDIRVLSENGTERTCKCEVCLVIYHYLIDAINICLYRILYSDDVYIYLV